jgi:hypothetical protein
METVQITYLGSNDQYQEYNTSDLALVNTSFITPSFGGPTDYIELFIKDIEALFGFKNLSLLAYPIRTQIVHVITPIVFLNILSYINNLGKKLIFFFI